MPAQAERARGKGCRSPTMTGPLGFPCEPVAGEWPPRPVDRPGPQRHRGRAASPARRVEGAVGPGIHSPAQGPTTAQPVDRQVSPVPLRVVMLYDMDACHGPTGVTRHALAQLERLARRADVALRLISGRMIHPDGLAYWASLENSRGASCRSGRATSCGGGGSSPGRRSSGSRARPTGSTVRPSTPCRRGGRGRAVTSHDVLQHLRFQPPKNRELLASAFGKADLILSVSQFNTRQLIEAFPGCRDRVAQVPNAAEDLFFEPASPRERELVRTDLGLPPRLPYLLSVANFQPRKNLVRLIQAVAALPEVAAGDLALVLLGTGAEDEARPLREAIATAGRRAMIRMPGYRQGKILRAAYAEAAALVFPSLCESFGIPVVEAMAQGIPAALADSTALPEIGGDAGWYFDPESQDAITATLRDLLDHPEECGRRVALGRTIAERYRWQTANVASLTPSPARR